MELVLVALFAFVVGMYCGAILTAFLDDRQDRSNKQ